MALQTEVRAALAAIAVEETECNVTVIDAAGTSGTAVADEASDPVEWESAGAGGKSRGLFRVSAASLTFDRGDLITVGGKRATVDDARKDGLGALWVVSYTIQE